MVRIIPLFSMIFNFYFLWALEGTISVFFPTNFLPLNSFMRSLIIYVVILFLLYTPFGQRVVAFFARGRNTIGREERKLEPIIEQLKDRTDIRGYSAPVWFQYHILNALNNLTVKSIKPLDRRVNRIKYEFMTGTVKIFTYDSMDIETNSFGNSIFISKGCFDSLTQGELTAVVYNEFAQIKANISNKRLLHDAGILLGRASAILLILLAPVALIAIAFHSVASTVGNHGLDINANITLAMFLGQIIGGLILGLLRIIILGFMKLNKLNFTQLPYMFYERRIFVEADRATHKAGFSNDMLSYLDKLYAFKLNPKDFTKLFVELRPLVSYRINFFENVLGKNRDLSVDNYAWSSNYMDRVQVINNNKS